VAEGRPDVVNLIVQGAIDLVVDTPSGGRNGRHPPAASGPEQWADARVPPSAE
jgi:hypothetical protein